MESPVLGRVRIAIRMMKFNLFARGAACGLSMEVRSRVALETFSLSKLARSTVSRPWANRPWYNWIFTSAPASYKRTSSRRADDVVRQNERGFRMQRGRMIDSAGDRVHSTADWLLLAVPGVIWGASFLFIAEGLRSIGPNGLTFCRILVGFVTLSCFPSARKPVRRSDWVGIAAIGVLWMAFPLSLFPY